MRAILTRFKITVTTVRLFACIRRGLEANSRRNQGGQDAAGQDGRHCKSCYDEGAGLAYSNGRYTTVPTSEALENSPAALGH